MEFTNLLPQLREIKNLKECLYENVFQLGEQGTQSERQRKYADIMKLTHNICFEINKLTETVRKEAQHENRLIKIEI